MLHLHLHRATPFKGGAAADDQSEIVRSQLRVILGSIIVRVTSAREDGAALDARLQALFPQSQPFEFLEAVSLRCATVVSSASVVSHLLVSRGRSVLDHGVLEQGFICLLVMDGRLDHCTSASVVGRVLELPSAATLIVQ